MALGSGGPERLTDAFSAPSWSVEASFGTFCDDALTCSGRRFRVRREAALFRWELAAAARARRLW